MYVSKSLLDGLNILGFDKTVIKRVARERNLEEIFLSTLFLNYFIVLVIYLVGLVNGGYTVAGRELNMPVFFGLLMVYPFLFNLIVFVVYGLFGLMAELLDKKMHVKPLIAVGFHTAIVYTILLYVIGILTTVNVQYGMFLLTVFLVYFLYTMFVSIAGVYRFSFSQTLIVLFTPFLLLSLIGLGLALMDIDVLTPLALLFLQ